ncbi:MAG TPA: hypothetical protein DCP92_06370 [Nitrospiraceae bacterium]|jgi:hypothetical protein|nr:hypothetical protein [Nitrospiraceae bacterium]
MDAKAKRHQRFIVDHLGVSAKTLFVEEAELLNVSVTGACIIAKESLTLADKHLMKLYNDGTPLTLQYRVIWETSSDEPKDRSGELVTVYKAGVAFAHTPIDSLGMLKDYIWVSAIPNEQRLRNTHKPSILRFTVHTNAKALLYYSKIAAVKELSLSGMLIEVDKGIPVDRRFPLGLFLPKENLPIKFQGRVACCIELPDTESKGFDIGIQFLGMAEEDKRRLSKFLETLTPTPLHEKLRRLLRKTPSFRKRPE